MTAQTVPYKAKAFDLRNLAFFFLIVYGLQVLKYGLLYTGVIKIPSGEGLAALSAGPGILLITLASWGPLIAAFLVTAGALLEPQPEPEMAARHPAAAPRSCVDLQPHFAGGERRRVSRLQSPGPGLDDDPHLPLGVCLQRDVGGIRLARICPPAFSGPLECAVLQPNSRNPLGGLAFRPVADPRDRPIGIHRRIYPADRPGSDHDHLDI